MKTYTNDLFFLSIDDTCTNRSDGTWRDITSIVATHKMSLRDIGNCCNYLFIQLKYFQW